MIVETLATGRPALVTRTGGSPEMLTGEFERFLVEPGDTAGLAAALEQLVDWQKHDPTLGERCTAHVRDHFSLELLVDGVERSLTLAAGNLSRKGAAWT